VSPRGKILHLKLRGAILLGALLVCHAAAAQSPRDSYQQAVSHMQKGEWEPAVELLEKVIEAVPGNAKLHNTLGIALSSAGRADAAAEQFQRALELEPSYPSPLKNLALHEMSRKRPDEAKEYFERLLKLTSGDAVAHLGLAEIAFAKGAFADAIPHFQNGGDLLLKDPRLVVNFAKSYVETKQPSKATGVLDTIPQTADPDLHFEAGLMLASLESYSSAAREFERAQGGEADLYELGFNLTLAYLNSGQHERAAATGERLLAQGHQKGELYNLLSQVHEQARDTQRAYDALRTATDIDPGDETNYIDLVALCLDHKNFDLGLEIADISVKRVPESHRLHLQRGVALAMKGRFEDAEAAFDRSAELAPDKNLPGVALGLILMQQDRVPEAIGALRERRERGNDDYMLHWFLAEALNRSGVQPGTDEEAEAVEALERSVELNPELFQSRVLLGKMLMRRGALDRAIKHLEKARTIDPADVSAAYQLAQVYRKMGDAERAKELFAIVGKQKDEEREEFTRGGLLRIVREGSP
jgi:tetratricopeptide (TPR) repeat protein